MKKNIFGLLALIVAFVVATPSQAQIQFGVKAGLNMNKVSLSGESLGQKIKDNGKNTTGFFVGATADVKIPLVGLGADISLLYDNKKMEFEDGPNKTLHYIDLPINAKYTIGFSSLASIYLATGPQFSWNVGGKKWATDATNGWELKKSEFSWNIGAGATLLKHVRVGYNYNIAIGKTADLTILNATTSAVKGKLKNNTHQISLTYLF